MENCSIDRFTHPQGCFLFFEESTGISVENGNLTKLKGEF